MPFSDHLVGLALRTALRRPWLADFRDPWMEYIHWPQWQSDWGRRLTAAAEAAVVRHASYVVSVNEHMTRRFVSRYGGEKASKFITISNGFDPADFKKGRKPRPSAHFRLIYAGSLYGARSPEKVLDAFRRFIRMVPGSRQHARFVFLGRPGPHIDKLANPADGDTVQYLGMLSHAAALEALVEADLNVVILPNVLGSANDTTTKIYESLGSGRPILAAVPLEGAAAGVLRRFEAVSLCDPDDVTGMAEAITDWYRRWLAGDNVVSRQAEALAPLTRQWQTSELATLLDSAVSAKKTPVRHSATQ